MHMEPKFTSEIKVELIDHMGGDHYVVAAARVSTQGKDARAFIVPTAAEENAGLINYLIKHRHGTPFEHGGLIFYVHAPILVWREWHRHRIGFSYNEESARYKPLEPVFYIPPRDRPMIKIDDWKPGRPKFEYCQSEGEYEALCLRLKSSYTYAYAQYEENLKAGFDPGLARDCLPVGIYSGCWVTCNPRSVMAFLSLRIHNPDSTFVSYPLYEIQKAAEQVEQHFANFWPLTYAAFVKNGRVGP